MAERWTLEEFYDKMDHEGGLAELFAWGGLNRIVSTAPPEIVHYVISAAKFWEGFKYAEDKIVERLGSRTISAQE